jgi:hypothetical protein
MTHRMKFPLHKSDSVARNRRCVDCLSVQSRLSRTRYARRTTMMKMTEEIVDLKTFEIENKFNQVVIKELKLFE